MSDIGKGLHISWSELACKDGTPYPVKLITDGTLIELIVMFERIRFVVNEPLIINSAYRTASWNKKVGGSPRSQHLLGKALDIRPPKNVSAALFYELLKERHKEFGIRGLGKYKDFVHCDIRDSKELVTWEG